MKTIQIRDEYIKLGQALKLSGLCDSGAEAKQLILEEKVKVNQEVCTMRGKKLYDGDVFSFDGKDIKVKSMVV
jgi:ribosome-associated protein